MKKGFIHIIEVIVIILIGFLIVYQFSVLPGIPQQFDRTILELQGKDIIYTADAFGINWLNRDNVRLAMEWFLNGTSASYAVTIRNAIKTPISVGCICDNTDFLNAQTTLQPVTVNGEHVQFVVTQLTPPSPATCTSFTPTFPLVFDTILLYNTNLSDDLGCQTYDYSSQIRGFLGSGKGIVQIRDLTPDHLQGVEGGIYRSFFGIEYAPGIAHRGGIVEVLKPGSPLYAIRQYFHGIPFLQDDFQDSVADLWVPKTNPEGRWRIRNFPNYVYEGQNLGVGTIFNQYTGQLPENYTVRFEGLIQFYGFAWSPEFFAEDNFLFAGVSDGTLVIGNQDTFSPSLFTYNYTLSNIVVGTWYNFVFTKQSEHVTFQVWNGSGLVGEVTATIPITGTGQVGLLLNDTSGVQIDNFRVSLSEKWTFAPFVSNEDVNASTGVVLQDLAGTVALVAQDAVPAAGNRGRIAWLSAGADQEDKLLRALVAWSAGSDYVMIPRTVPNPLTVSLLKVAQYDFFQPYTVDVSIGYSF